MGLFDLGDFLGGVASGVGTVAQGWMNYKATQDTNAANIKMNEANNAQNLALTQQSWRRDDNAIRRRVADMRAAGLNPVLAAGQGAQSTPPIAMQSGRAQAPQMSGLGDAISKGAATYSALVQARELRDQQKALTETMEWNRNTAEQNYYKTQHEASVAAATSDRLRHDNEFYKANRLPTNATGVAKDMAELRSLIKEKLLLAEEKGVNVQGLLDLLGGY